MTDAVGNVMKTQYRADNLPEPIRAKDVRRLRPCAFCGGVGDSEQMVKANDDHIHTSCYAEGCGLDGVLALQPREQDKFRLCDLGVEGMRRLVNERNGS